MTITYFRYDQTIRVRNYNLHRKALFVDRQRIKDYEDSPLCKHLVKFRFVATGASITNVSLLSRATVLQRRESLYFLYTDGEVGIVDDELTPVCR